jgi:Uma2 family endonuclease
MVSPTKRITVEDFDEWVFLPENADKLFEFIGGEIIEVPSNPYSSEVAYEIGFHIKLFLRKKGVKGHVTGEAGGYMVSGERYAPDVAYISSEKQVSLPYKQGYNPNPPELAVEVMSPTDNERNLGIKVSNYLAAGTVVWVVRPDRKEVEIHSPAQAVKVLTEKDTLEGDTVLEGFSLAVKEIFPQK